MEDRKEKRHKRGDEQRDGGKYQEEERMGETGSEK